MPATGMSSRCNRQSTHQPANEPMEPTIIPREDHPVSRKHIDQDTLRVLYKLKDMGFDAYLVGGAVRDIMMGRHPKDFDVATNARPHELRKIFRNSRIVGKRFRIVHVFYGSKNIEVATLRSAVEITDSRDDLYIEDDNQWGDLKSDAFRRDFTVNALYYNINGFAVTDYTGGMADLHNHIIRTIGDPMVRFCEDPVRMLRAIKFAARYGYKFEAKTEDALEDLPEEIHKASRFRVTEEVFRILTQPNRERGMRMLFEFGFLDEIYPSWMEAIGDDGFEQVAEFFAAVDRDAEDGRFYPLEVLCAGMFLPLLDSVDIQVDNYHKVASRITTEIGKVARGMDLPRRLAAAAVDLIRGQYYLLFFHHRNKRVQKYVQYTHFDLVWRLHLLAFGHVAELRPVQDLWADARDRVHRPIGGVVESPDRRDIFSFRGKTGGGRAENGRTEGARKGPRFQKNDDDWDAFDDSGE